MYEVYLYHALIKELCRCYRPCICALCSSFSRLVYTVGYVIMSSHPQYMHTYTNIQYTTLILCLIANYREHAAILHFKISALRQCNQLGYQGIEKALAISMLHLQQYLSLAAGKGTVNLMVVTLSVRPGKDWVEVTSSALLLV